MPRMKNWMFVNAMGIAVVPEVDEEGHEFAQPRFFGEIYDDPRGCVLTTEFADGHRVITSPIREANWEERFVKTRSGTIYYFEGHPHEDYVKWLKDNSLWDKYCDSLLPLAN